MKAHLIVSLLVSFSSSAFAAESVAVYSCSAQKAVGWVTKEDGSSVIGQFKPDTKAFAISYHPAEISFPRLKLPSIEIPNRDGGTSELISDVCDGLSLWNGDETHPEMGWAVCRAAIKVQNREGFGSGRMQFSEALAARPSFVSYVEVSVSPGGNSYLTEGECGLAGLTPLTD